MNHKVVQLRRGTTAQNNTITGAEGEVTVDTDKKTAVVHDGHTLGGFPLRRDDDEQTRVRYLTYRAAITQQGIPSLGFSSPENAPTPIAIMEGEIISGAASFAKDAEQSIQDHFTLPFDWVEPLGLEILWRSSAIVGTVRWSVETCGVPIGGVLSDATFNPQNDVLANVGSGLAYELVTTTIDLDTTNMEPEGEVFFKLKRLSSDTLTSAAELISLRFLVRVKGK